MPATPPPPTGEALARDRVPDGAQPAPSLADVRWVREAIEPGRISYRVGRKDAYYVAEWDGIGALWARSPSSAELFPVAGLDPVYEDKWRRGLVHALVRHLVGRTTLHGSAVVIAGRAIVFLGESGTGKSTCAADLCGRLGAELLADDTVEIDAAPPGAGGFLVAASEASHWLLRDSAEALGHGPQERWKQPVEAARPARAAVPLGAIVALSFGPDGSAPAISALRGLEAFTVINQSYVRFVFDEPDVAARDLDAIADLVATVPIVTLARAPSLTSAALARTADALSQFVHNLPRGATPRRQPPTGATP